MNKLLAITIASASIAIGAIPAVAEIDPKIHKLCLDAKDYSGCVKTMSGKDESVNNQSSTAERCWGDGLERMCLAKEGTDNLGMPKLINWFYKYDASGDVMYYEANIERTDALNKPIFKYYFIPHKGRKRYTALKGISRFIVKAKPGYSGSSTTIGNATTNCTSYGGQTSCNTTPAPTINIPGRSAVPARIDTLEGLIVYDCKDKTVGIYFGEEKGERWEKRPSIASCSEVPFEKLETMNFKL